MPKSVAKRTDYLEETGFFTKETMLYHSLIPVLLEHSSIAWVPQSYLTKDNCCIVLENLKDHKIFSNKQLIFDYEHLKVAAETTAKFHASSVIMEEKTGRKLTENYAEMLKEVAYPREEGCIRRCGLENGIKVLSELIKMIPKYEEPSTMQTIQRKFPDTMRRIYDFVETSSKYRNVFNHGDLWVNNFMFDYGEDGKPNECKLVDFQLGRYSPPAVDLVQTIYINSTKELRNKHLDDILNIYCDTFENELRRNNLKLSLLPRTEILESFHELHLAGLLEACGG